MNIYNWFLDLFESKPELPKPSIEEVIIKLRYPEAEGIYINGYFSSVRVGSYTITGRGNVLCGSNEILHLEDGIIVEDREGNITELCETLGICENRLSSRGKLQDLNIELLYITSILTEGKFPYYTLLGNKEL